MSYAQRLRQFNRGTRFFLANSALTGFAQSGIFGVLLNLYLLRLGYDTAFIGKAGAVFALAFCVASPLGGLLATRHTHRALMLAGMALGVLGFAMIPCTGLLPLPWHSIWVLGSIALAYLGYGLYGVVMMPFLMDITTAEERSHAFSLQMAISPLASFLGSLLAGQLPGLFASLTGQSAQAAAPYALALALTPLLSLFTLPLVWAMTRGTRAVGRQQETERGPYPFALVAVMMLLMILRWGGQGPAFTFFNVYLDSRLGASAATIGLLTGLGRLMSAPAALIVPALIARTGKFRAILGGSIGIGLSLLPLALIPSLFGAGAGYLGVQAFFVLTSPAFTLFSLELTTPGWRTAMASASNFATGLGMAAMALGGGYLIGALGYRTLFLVGAGLSILCAGLFGAYFRTARGEMKELAL
jgi:MFS family permease